MTVKELKERLEDFHEDAPICFAEQTHDYWRTIKALDIKAVETLPVVYSHRCESLIIDKDNFVNTTAVVIHGGYI